jgi:hypothetical protein
MAQAAPRALVIGVDTNASGFREASRRAARRAPNALFLVADAAAALAGLHGRLDEVRITLPWGSLLRAVAEGEQAFAHAVAGSL